MYAAYTLNDAIKFATNPQALLAELRRLEAQALQWKADEKERRKSRVSKPPGLDNDFVLWASDQCLLILPENSDEDDLLDIEPEYKFKLSTIYRTADTK
jgi:hypothetical protein